LPLAPKIALNVAPDPGRPRALCRRPRSLPPPAPLGAPVVPPWGIEPDCTPRACTPRSPVPVRGGRVGSFCRQRKYAAPYGVTAAARASRWPDLRPTIATTSVVAITATATGLALSSAPAPRGRRGIASGWPSRKMTS
jgi:hypothetical protein